MGKSHSKISNLKLLPGVLSKTGVVRAIPVATPLKLGRYMYKVKPSFTMITDKAAYLIVSVNNQGQPVEEVRHIHIRCNF